MATQNKKPPRPNWSEVDLPPAHQQELKRLEAIETKYRVAAAVGMAFIGYACNGEPSDTDLEQMEFAWYYLVTEDAY